jgi:hypothetical protein
MTLSTRAGLVVFLGVVGWTAMGGFEHTGISRSKRDGASEIAPVPSGYLVRYRFDAARDQGWLLTAEGVFLYGATNPERVFVPLPSWQWVGPPQGCLPDLAIGPNGEAVITSDIVPTFWRVDPETLTVTVHALELEGYANKDAGFSGLVYRPDRRSYFAASALDGALWGIDPTLTRAAIVLPAKPDATRGRRGFRCDRKALAYYNGSSTSPSIPAAQCHASTPASSTTNLNVAINTATSSRSGTRFERAPRVNSM